MSKKIITIIVAAVFVAGVFIGGAGVYLWNLWKKCQSLPEFKQTEQTESEKITYFNEIYGYSLKIPREWVGKYIIRESGRTVSFYYVPVKNDLPYDIFSITVYSEDEWKEWEKERKEAEAAVARGEESLAPGCCPEVFAGDAEKGTVFVYNTPLDVPYVDQTDIDEFIKMSGQIQEIITSFSLSK